MWLKIKNKKIISLVRCCFLIAVLHLQCRNTKISNSDQISEKLPWSERMANTLMQKHPNLSTIEGNTKVKWEYTFGLVALSFIDLWANTNDTNYYNYAKNYVDTLLDQTGKIKTYKIEEYNLDRINPGKVLFTLYKQTGDNRYKNALHTLRQQLQNHPRTKVGGFWHKKKYENQMWLDGVYMAAPFYAQYAKEFNEPEDFTDIANWIITMEKVTRDTVSGLLYHGWDESHKQKWSDTITGCSPNFWGRGMGWYGMALVDVLDYFPEEHPMRDSIISIIQRMADAIIKVQEPKTGLWYQVLDKGDRPGNYLEGSVSCMFSYFLLKAVNKGYIDKSYLSNAKTSYTGIITHLIHIENDGSIVISPVCAVAGLGGDPYRDGSYEYYINEKRTDNDPKAVGPFIMASLLYEQFELDKK